MLYYRTSQPGHSKIALIVGVLIVIAIMSILIYYFMKFKEHPSSDYNERNKKTDKILRLVNTLDSTVKIKHGEIRSTLKPLGRKIIPLIRGEKIRADVGKSKFDITISNGIDTLYVKPTEFGTNRNTDIGKIENNSNEPLIFSDGKSSYRIKPNNYISDIPITKGDKWSVKREHETTIIDNIIIRDIRNTIVFHKNKLHVK